MTHDEINSIRHDSDSEDGPNSTTNDNTPARGIYLRRLLESFVADLEHYKECLKIELNHSSDEKRHHEVMGAYFAAPAKTGRSK